MTYTAEEKFREAARELLMRTRVYPRMIAQEKMTAKDAAEKIALMQEIAAEYEELAKKERLL